jgi:acyl-CoA reductase-like NAD-dependent aldehyde dehydrogenase
MSSPNFPEPPPKIPATPLDQVDAAIERVADRADAWLQVGLEERVQLLLGIVDGMKAVGPQLVEDGCRAKGIDPNSGLAGEEWLATVVTTIRNARLLAEALQANGQPQVPSTRTRPDGQVVAQVFPTNLQDKLMFTGFQAEVWIEPGKPATQGAIYREAQGGSGRVCGVLGAGNVGSIPPMDVLYKLFVENEVVVLKMNPVNEHVGPHLEQAFKALVDTGYLAVVYGGVEVGQRLVTHDRVDTLHVTGSDRTYDAIVWGLDDQAGRKERNEPINTRPFTAELGCVTPVLIVPGPWSEADLDWQAQSVAGMVTQNGSFNCNAAKVVITARGWELRDRFLAKLRQALATAPARKAYYPGAQQRHQGFLDHYEQAEVVGQAGDDIVPWTWIPGVKAEKGEYALTNEAFCGLLAQTDLDCSTPAEFLRQATDFANDQVWGTLSCMVVVHPKTMKAHAAELEQAIADLRYGGVAVNCWAGLIYGLVVTSWGAFPGHPPEDIRSGNGVVHNTFLFDHPQKSVLRGPFKINPPPVWWPTGNTTALGKKMVEMESEPSWGKLVGVALAAFKS